MKGEGLSRKVYGVPTANLDAMVMRSNGVYAARVKFDAQEFDALVSIQEDKTEVHLLDFKGDLYGRELHVKLLERVCDMVRRDHIKDYVERVRHRLYGPPFEATDFGPQFA